MSGKRIFVIGMPRTGTTIISELICLDDDYILFNEDGSNYPTSRYVESLLKEGKNVVQKMPNQCLNVKKLVEKYPDAYYIFMNRNLRDIVNSYKKYEHNELLGVGDIINPHKIYELYIKEIEYLNPKNRLNIHLSNFHQFPEMIVKQIYEFIGKNFEKKHIIFIRDFVSKTPSKNSPLLAYSVNSK